MRNFVMLYRFNDRVSEDQFQNFMQAVYPQFKVDNYEGIFYYGFPAKNLPEVKDQLYDKIQNIPFGSDDYVALYFKRDENGDDIQQNMVIGNAALLEGHVESKVGTSQHVQNLQRLIGEEISANA